MLLAGLAGGAALSTVMAPKMPTPQIPDAVKPPASQATKAPERAASVTANAAAASPGGALGGNSSTFLTGPSGIDPSMLNLGKNKLLGQ
jgi:hypothetical protein